MKDLPSRIKCIEETLARIDERQRISQETKEAMCRARHQQFLVRISGAVLAAGTGVVAIWNGVGILIKHIGKH